MNFLCLIESHFSIGTFSKLLFWKSKQHFTNPLFEEYDSWFRKFSNSPDYMI